MANNGVTKENSVPVTQNGYQGYVIEQPGYYPAYDRERAGKVVDEIIMAVKDDRANTKRVISADIASTARIQNQNDRLMAVYERELRRPGISEERREELIALMRETAESTAREGERSRRFQEHQLEHSHKLLWKILGAVAVLAVGGIGGTALIRSVA